MNSETVDYLQILWSFRQASVASRDTLLSSSTITDQLPKYMTCSLFKAATWNICLTAGQSGCIKAAKRNFLFLLVLVAPVGKNNSYHGLDSDWLQGVPDI